MEEMIHNLVRNTLKKENAEDIISEKISWYEMQIKKRNDILNKIKEIINYYAIENEDYSKIYNQEEQEIMKLLEEIE